MTRQDSHSFVISRYIAKTNTLSVADTEGKPRDVGTSRRRRCLKPRRGVGGKEAEAKNENDEEGKESQDALVLEAEASGSFRWE